MKTLLPINKIAEMTAIPSIKSSFFSGSMALLGKKINQRIIKNKIF